MKVDLARIQIIDSLIKRKFTGPPHQLAEKLGISVRALHNLLNYMKTELGAPIVYNHVRKSYCYNVDGYFCFTYQSKEKSVSVNEENV